MLDIAIGEGENPVVVILGEGLEAFLCNLAPKEAWTFIVGKHALCEVLPGGVSNLLTENIHPFGGHFAVGIGPAQHDRAVLAYEACEVEGALGLAGCQEIGSDPRAEVQLGDLEGVHGSLVDLACGFNLSRQARSDDAEEDGRSLHDGLSHISRLAPTEPLNRPPSTL